MRSTVISLAVVAVLAFVGGAPPASYHWDYGWLAVSGLFMFLSILVGIIGLMIRLDRLARTA